MCFKCHILIARKNIFMNKISLVDSIFFLLIPVPQKKLLIIVAYLINTLGHSYYLRPIMRGDILGMCKVIS